MLANLPTGPYAVTVQRDVRYADHHPRLTLDLMHPTTPGTQARAVIMHLHGGGYSQGQKNIDDTVYLASRGWITASINYRLSATATFPAPLDDATAALQWLRANASTHGIDPDRIGVWGISAGAHLAASLLTMGTEALQAVSMTAGYFDLLANTSTHEESRLRMLLGRMLNTEGDLSPAQARAVSPQHHIPTNALPPIHLLHGTADDIVPFSQSTEFVMALREAGHAATLDTIPGAGHMFEQGAWFQVEQRTLSYFERVLPPVAG
jgi:acetyl esterase/lipase